jgi:Outer membrane protein TOM13
MSFPEPSLPHSPEHSLHAPRATTTPAARPVTTASVTLAVFDPTLPARARIWALFSSLSINMFLPFVNGVMLGFGEIFAKTVIVGWLGWGSAVAANVGLGVRPENRSQNRWW